LINIKSLILYLYSVIKENKMKARKILIYGLLIVPALILAGCSETTSTEEPRAILIPPEDGGPIVFVQPHDGPPPPTTGQEPPGQVPLPSTVLEQSMITTAKSHSGISGLIPEGAEIVPLPAPQIESSVSLEEALSGDNLTGHYTELPLTISDISQLLWAAHDITGEEGDRKTPSISSTYPLALYLITGNVTDLKSGSYLYIPAEHELAVIKDGSFIDETGLLTEQTAKSAVYIIVTADFEEIPDISDEDTERLVFLEAGRAAQNIHLQATSLGIGTVIIVNFTEEQVERAAGIPAYLKMIYVMPVGEKAGL
jgi:SagB-type dehydrogenase family enzyme